MIDDIPTSLSLSLSHFQKGVNDIVAGLQRYQSPLLDNLRKQMEAKEAFRKHIRST
jgi:hypothetical protein